MTDRILRCLLGDPLLAAFYRNNSLNLHDRHRIEHAPQLAERTDWKVSRALKQLADSPVVSLSHSKGFAALLCTDCPIPAGVDLEAIRPNGYVPPKNKNTSAATTGRRKYSIAYGAPKKPY